MSTDELQLAYENLSATQERCNSLLKEARDERATKRRAHRALRLVAAGIKEELQRGYVLTHEPGAGLAWSKRWNDLLAEVEASLLDDDA